MALTYDIDLKTDASAEQARALLLATGRFARYEDALNGGGVHVGMFRDDPSDSSRTWAQDYHEEMYGFRYDLSVGLTLDKFERWEEARRTAVETVALLARALGETSRATYQSDYVVFVQRGDVLVLDETWADQHPDLVPLAGTPVQIEDLRGPEEAREAALG